jgi:predicted ATPase/DNA-binding CsgD family transcriptional regulator
VETSNLPTFPTPFIGRQDELADISRLLADPACHLLTLVGPGGVGKTRLALAAALLISDVFPDGVYFVPLQPLQAIDLLIPAIAQAIEYEFFGASDPKTQLLSYVSDKSMLLVLDNFEHLLEGVELVADILASAAGVIVLVTSREVLNLQEEWLYPVKGMRYPAGDIADDARQYDAVELFVRHARRVRPDFSLDTERPWVMRVCEQVEGMPLALELAAAWLKRLPCREIVTEIERGLDILENPVRNVPARHRSMRAVLEHSWSLLAEAERDVLKKLSVFRGGFRREAAERVVGATLATLSALVDKSMLRVNSAGRYDIHELMRQFAEGKLVETPGAHEQIQDWHTSYYLDFLHEMEAKLKGPEQIAALDEIEVEIENIRTAWQRASALRQEQELDYAIEGLALFYMMRSRAVEGERVFGQTLHDLGLMENALFAKVLLFLARFVLTQDSDRSVELAQRGLSLWRTHVQPGEGGFSLGLIQSVLAPWFYSNKSYSDEFHELEKNLIAFRHKGDHWGEAWLLYCLGTLALDSGRTGDAYPYLKESVSIFRVLGNPWAVTFALGNLTQLLTESGRYEEARELIQENQATNRMMGDLQGIIYTCWQLAEIAYVLGDDRNLKSHIHEALQVALKIHSYPLWLPVFSPLIVHLLTKAGAAEQAVELGALSDRAFNHLTYKNRSWDESAKRVVEQLQALEAELNPQMFLNAKRRGEAKDPETFVRYLLDQFLVEEQTSPAVVVRSQGLAEPLSERELEVLRLVAQGLSNREIARELVLSLGTVKTHIHNICGKLDAASRTQAIARARDLHLI